MAEASCFDRLQKEKRFKKLERSLKLAVLMRRTGRERGRVLSPVSTSPSISSINDDGLDSSCTVPLLQSSRVGSEVVASSNNLKNILLKMGQTDINHAAMTTSSVKQYPIKATTNRADQLMMPPPFTTAVHSSSKIGKPQHAPYNVPSNVIDVENMTGILMMDHASSKNEASYEFSGGNMHDGIGDETGHNDYKERRVRVFSRWRVVLSEEGQLIIKGTMECGRIARSKPVIKRLTATSVMSKYKHHYSLEGNIVDDRNDLPDYVRGKFYNGFPDDWENVHQVWRSFISLGSPVIFHWPTAITDSDDDLNSAITEFSVCYGKQSKSKVMSPESHKESCPPKEHILSEYSAKDCREVASIVVRRNHTSNTNDSFRQTCISHAEENLYNNKKIDAAIDQKDCDKENLNQQVHLNTSLSSQKRSNKLEDILKEDKLNIIINNLADKNCSSEYIQKIVEMFECLNYAVSYKSFEHADSYSNESKDSDNKISIEEEGIESGIASRDYGLSKEIDLQPNASPNKQRKNTQSSSAVKSWNSSNSIDTDNSIARTANLSPGEKSLRKRTYIEMAKGNEENSESEMYTGTPNISLERIMRQKEALPRPSKRKLHKKTIQPETQKQGNAGSQSDPSFPEHQNYAKASAARKPSNFYLNDSSVSITESETSFCRARKFINPSLLDQGDRPRATSNALQINVVHTPRPIPRKGSNTVLKENETREKPAPMRREYESATNDCTSDSDSITEGETNTNAYNAAKEIHSRIADKENEQNRMSNEIASQQMKVTAKRPVARVFSTVLVDSPIVISATKIKSNHSLHDDRTSNKEINVKERGRVTRAEKSPRKASPPKRTKVSDNVEPTSVGDDTKQHPAGEGKIQQDNTSPSISSEISNKQLLSCWTPRVVCCSEMNSELGLVFEGKLLNEVRHVAHRKFITNTIVRRVSPNVIETIDHKFYELVGDLNNTKHIVPKELLSKCRYGCPSHIQKFCKIWATLKPDDVASSENKPVNATVGELNVLMSSKGRRILPPLNYWTGERVSLRDNNLIYCAGTTLDSALTVSCESPRKTSNVEKIKNQPMNPKSETKQGRNINTPPVHNQDKSPSRGRMTSEINKRNNFNSREERIAQQLFTSTESSSDGEEVVVLKIQNGKGTHREISRKGSGHTIKKSTKARKEETVLQRAPVVSSKVIKSKLKSSVSGHMRNIVCTYLQEIPLKDDTLSDDELSHI